MWVTFCPSSWKDSEHSAQIASVIEEAWAPQYTYIGIILDTDAIQKLQVGLCPLMH